MTKINFKNSKLLASLLVCATLMMSMTPISFAQTTGGDKILDPSLPEDAACLDKIEQDMQLQGSKIDSVKAISQVSGNEELKSKLQGYNSAFNSIFGNWNFDTTSCTAALQNVNIVYSLSRNNVYVKNVVATLDPALTKISSVSEHVGSFNFNSTTSTNWSGYEFVGASPNPPIVYEAKATWTVPSVSEPWSGACFFTHCDLAIWSGLEDTLGATNKHLAQAGTDSGVYCTSGCSYFYNSWYEFLPNASVQCTGKEPSPSDSMRVTITNQAKNGGSQSQYTALIEDLTKSTACGVVNYDYPSMTTPHYAPFINERPIVGGSTARLPQFSSDTVTGYMYYSGSEPTIYTPFNAGLYTKSTMINGGNTNIVISGVNTSGQYTSTWHTSNGT